MHIVQYVLCQYILKGHHNIYPYIQYFQFNFYIGIHIVLTWVTQALYADISLCVFQFPGYCVHFKFHCILGNNFLQIQHCSHLQRSSVHTIADNVDTQSVDTTITLSPQERTLSCHCICSGVLSWQGFYLATPALLGIWKMTRKKALETLTLRQLISLKPRQVSRANGDVPLRCVLKPAVADR